MGPLVKFTYVVTMLAAMVGWLWVLSQIVLGIVQTIGVADAFAGKRTVPVGNRSAFFNFLIPL